MKPYRLWVCAALLLPRLLLAHGDEDHGAAAAAPAAPAARPLRVEAASEAFELVGQLQNDKLVLHLDRFATNEPVTGAAIDVEGGPLKPVTTTEHDGVYSIPAAALAVPGTHALVFTVRSGAVTDLLTGDLVVAEPPAAAAAAHLLPTRWIVAVLVVLLVAGAAVFAWRRRRIRGNRTDRLAGALR